MPPVADPDRIHGEGDGTPTSCCVNLVTEFGGMSFALDGWPGRLLYRYCLELLLMTMVTIDDGRVTVCEVAPNIVTPKRGNLVVCALSVVLANIVIGYVDVLVIDAGNNGLFQGCLEQAA